jgi:hypothetical protein
MPDRSGLAIRLRDPWEAVDLGFVLLRKRWPAVIGAWLAVVLPLAAALFALFRHHLWVPPLVLWWLKPALDRVVLHVLAKATFGEIPDLGSTLGSAPHMVRHGLLASLTWRRFSPQRSFVLPVWQLEEQPGEGFRRRSLVLLRKDRTQAVGLTLVCLLFEVALFFGALAGLAFFAPRNADFGVMDAAFGSGSDRLPWLDALLAVLPILSMTLVEPFYVAGGFSLYLNRRVELEGWDLEVAFRKLAARAAGLLGRGAAGLLLVLALAQGRLQGAAPARPTPEEALAEVLREPEFQVKQRKKTLHWKAAQQSPEPRSTSVPPGLLEFFKLLATVVKWGLIATAAALLGFVLWRHRGALARRFRSRQGEAPPDLLFGLDIRPESLPAGLDREAARLWSEGRTRAALALLYRGALAHLVHHHRAPLSRGATEGDCLRKARELLTPAAADYFARLTRTWLRVAYADLAPLPGSEHLCSEWPSFFREFPGEGRP